MIGYHSEKWQDDAEMLMGQLEGMTGQCGRSLRIP
jgi:hypothetical protein